jgi:hypothetical protein
VCVWYGCVVWCAWYGEVCVVWSGVWCSVVRSLVYDVYDRTTLHTDQTAHMVCGVLSAVWCGVWCPTQRTRPHLTITHTTHAIPHITTNTPHKTPNCTPHHIPCVRCGLVCVVWCGLVFCCVELCVVLGCVLCGLVCIVVFFSDV